MEAIETFNTVPTGRLTEDLLACCSVPGWASRIAAGRPYASRAAVLAAADAASAELGWDDVLKGLSAHPRIGERAAGDSREAVWSQNEQSAAAQSADETTRAALIDANRAYEDRFGHVFLIFASGRSQAEILAAALTRLGNDEEKERPIVTAELGKIAHRRLERLLDALE